MFFDLRRTQFKSCIKRHFFLSNLIDLYFFEQNNLVSLGKKVASNLDLSAVSIRQPEDNDSVTLQIAVGFIRLLYEI